MIVSSQLRKAALENLASDPVDGLASGRVYYNTVSNVSKIYDGSTWLTLASTSVAADSVDSYKVKNHSITASVAANAMTIALKQADGTNASAGSPVKIVFRSATLGSGVSVERTLTASLSTVISSGSTLGSVSGKLNVVYVYAIDNAGTIELAYSGNRIVDENSLVSTTAEGGAGAADSAIVLYSTSARSNVAARYLGQIKSTQATAGTWATTPSTISSNALVPRTIAPTVQTFTSGSGTYTTPTGVSFIKVRMVAGGGGGGGSAGGGNTNGGDGGSGGNTTFGTSLLSCIGGGAGGGNSQTGGSAGTASLGTGPIGSTLNGGVGQGGAITAVANITTRGGDGGVSFFGGSATGGQGDATAGSSGQVNTGSGGGGASTAQSSGSVNKAGGGGGAGGFLEAIINAPEATYAYAVGAGGTQGSAGTLGAAGGAGGSGYIEVYEFY